MKSEKKIYVIVVGHNSRQYLPDSLSALIAQTPKPKIIFVDNHSSDGSAEWVRQNFSEVAVIENKKNLGFAAGNNLGIKKALSQQADYIALVNPDTKIPPDWLKILIDFAEGNPRAGLIGSKILFAHNPEVLNSTGISLNLLGLSWDSGFGKRDLKGDTRPQEVLAVSGCAMFFRAEIFKKIGFFDEGLWSFCEDLDFCLRIIEKTNYKIIYLPAAVIKHKFSASFDARKNLKKFLMSRNSFIIIGRHFPLKFLFSSLWRRFQHEIVDLIFAFRARKWGNFFLELRIILAVLGRVSVVLAGRLFERGRDKITSRLIPDYEIPHHFPPMKNSLKVGDRNRLLIGINEKFLEEGFYHLENDFPLYRWIGRKAACYLEMPQDKEVYLQLHLCLAAHQQIPEVTVFIEDKKIGSFLPAKGWQTVILPVVNGPPTAGDMVCVVLKVSQTFFSKSILDNRELGLMIDEISLLGGGSPFLRQAGTIKNNEIIVGGQETGLGEGFYPQEDDGLCKFRWTKTAAVFNLSSLPKTAECLEILASAPDNSLRIFEVFANEQKIGQGILKSGWKIYQCFFRPAAAQLRLMIKVNRSLPETFKNAGDERELGMMISRISLVDI